MSIVHPLKPIYNKDSIVLILGSFPSVISRKNNFYYSNPKNRFWKILGTVFNEENLTTNEEKIDFLLNNHIALFDVIKSCEIDGSSDSSIKNVIPNDISKLIKNSKVKYIFTNGNKAHELYQKYIFKSTKIVDIKLPSTSPANCQKGIEEKLIEHYKKIKAILEESN